MSSAIWNRSCTDGVAGSGFRSILVQLTKVFAGGGYRPENLFCSHSERTALRTYGPSDIPNGIHHEFPAFCCLPSGSDHNPVQRLGVITLGRPAAWLETVAKDRAVVQLGTTTRTADAIAGRTTTGFPD